jgi:hypothetical protein
MTVSVDFEGADVVVRSTTTALFVILTERIRFGQVLLV